MGMIDDIDDNIGIKKEIMDLYDECCEINQPIEDLGYEADKLVGAIRSNRQHKHDLGIKVKQLYNELLK